MGRLSRLGNDLYTGRRSIDFVGRRWLWYTLSGVIVVVAVLGLSLRGLDYGIEFTGGAEYRVNLPAEQVTQSEVDDLREAVAATGIDDAASPVVTTSGSEAILVQTQPLTTAESEQVVDAILEQTGAGPDALSQSELGASWGEEIAQRALLGLAVFLVLVVLFIWAYFRQWKMSLAALVALAHDVLITIGVYALSGFEVTPATVTGLLTILGFSLYDTVVVFDKVRENTKAMKQTRMTYAESANLAVNQTLVRSINTSVVALLPVGAILYVSVVQLGSGNLKDLALALFVGMAAGTYSSIFIATPLLVHLKSGEDDVKLAEKRARARRRAIDADPYGGRTPSGRRDPVTAPDDAAPAGTGSGKRPTASGQGRTAPRPRSDVSRSAASGRNQPTRRPRSQRGKR
ncbi:protein translocase subunit SecF [Nocardioides sp. GXQ0305]|uniref:protein translocase subunit SecF n=1 Tax=Nocardioides sp. GXQ0305 TaxID=3423912 RepID=UPI003D7E99D1